MDSNLYRTISDRIYRIIWIEGPWAIGNLAADEKKVTQLSFEEQHSVFNKGN